MHLSDDSKNFYGALAMLNIHFGTCIEATFSEILINRDICNTRVWILDHPGDKCTDQAAVRIILEILWDVAYAVL